MVTLNTQNLVFFNRKPQKTNNCEKDFQNSFFGEVLATELKSPKWRFMLAKSFVFLPKAQRGTSARKKSKMLKNSLWSHLQISRAENFSPTWDSSICSWGKLTHHLEKLALTSEPSGQYFPPIWLLLAKSSEEKNSHGKNKILVS